MDFVGIVIFAIVLYVRPQEIVGFLSAFRPAQASLALAALGLFIREGGFSPKSLIRTPMDWMMTAYFVYILLWTPGSLGDLWGQIGLARCQFIFWISFAALFYTFLGYPLLIDLLAKFSGQPVRKSPPANPPRPDRMRLWLKQHIHVLGRPEWVFVKLHTHGGPPPNSGVFLGEPYRAFHQHLAETYTEANGWRLHYVTARELVNILHAAEDGHAGHAGQFRDYRYRLRA